MSNEILILLVTVLIGVALILLGNYKRIQRNRLIASGIRTEGTILSLEESYDGQTATYAPIVSYTTLQNETVTRKYSIGLSNKAYKPGDSIDIIYDTKNNNEFIIDNKLTKLLGPVIIAIGGVIILFSSLQYFFHPFNSNL